MKKLSVKRNINLLANFSWKGVSIISVIFALTIMFLILIFMIIKVDPTANRKNIILDVIFGTKYDVAKDHYGLAIPLLMTAITTFFALLIAIPLSVRCAIFIVFRIKKKSFKKILQGIIDLLAGIPSIVFGMFSLTIFGEFLQNLFGMQSSRNLLTAFFTLSFMIIPMITSLSINALYAAKKQHWNAAIALGGTSSNIIYKIIKPAAKKGIIIGIIIATTRALGESMALSIILQGSATNYNNIGISGFFNNSTPTLASLMARDFLGGDANAEIIPRLRGAFFAGGIAFFVMVFVLNVFILGYTKDYSWRQTLQQILNKYKDQAKTRIGGRNKLLKLEVRRGRHAFFPTVSDNFLITSKSDKKNPNVKQLPFDDELSLYITISQRWDLLRRITSSIKFFLELLAIIFVASFVSWIIIDTVLIKGAQVFGQTNYFFGTANSNVVGNSIGATIVSTLILIGIVILLSFPIALLCAVYMKEYARPNSKAVHIAKFFIDALGATPSIFFGIFGLVFFIETLNIYNPEKSVFSSSMMAGALTMMIVVLPTLIRSLEAALNNVPNDYKNGAIALGIPKWKVIYKIMVPAAIIGISTSVILTVGRILSETAPLYLTMGLSPNRPWFPNPGKTLLENGQTLTTRIYANIAFSSSNKDYLLAYEAAFFCVVIIIVLNILSYFLSNYVTKKTGLK